MKTESHFPGSKPDPHSLCRLTDENGLERQFELLDLVETDHDRYVVLWPLDLWGRREGSLVSILRVEVDGTGRESYTAVEDDDLLEDLFQQFKRNNRHYFPFAE